MINYVYITEKNLKIFSESQDHQEVLLGKTVANRKELNRNYPIQVVVTIRRKLSQQQVIIITNISLENLMPFSALKNGLEKQF